VVRRRLTWGEDAELAIGQVKEYITEALGEEPYKVYMLKYEKFGYKNTDFTQELYFPTWKTPMDNPLVTSTREAFKALYGKDREPGPCRYSTNAVAFAGKHHIPSVIIGPGDVAACHKPNETTRVSDLVTCSALYTMLPYLLI